MDVQKSVLHSYILRVGDVLIDEDTDIITDATFVRDAIYGIPEVSRTRKRPDTRRQGFLTDRIRFKVIEGMDGDG